MFGRLTLLVVCVSLLTTAPLQAQSRVVELNEEGWRLIQSGDAVIVTYETETSAGRRGRNTEIFTFDDEDKITRTEVYFGWDLE